MIGSGQGVRFGCLLGRFISKKLLWAPASECQGKSKMGEETQSRTLPTALRKTFIISCSCSLYISESWLLTTAFKKKKKNTKPTFICSLPEILKWTAQPQAKHALKWKSIFLSPSELEVWVLFNGIFPEMHQDRFSVVTPVLSRWLTSRLFGLGPK